MASSSGSPTTSDETSLTSASVKASAIVAVDEHALRRDAALAGVGEPGDADLGRRGLPVAVGLDDDRRVVAELEADLLARRPARIDHPTSGEPVNVMRAMSSWSTSALPTVEPPPVTTCSHSAGRPQSSMSSSARAMPLNGVWLAGLSTTGQPAAIAGASLWATRLSGKLNGLIAPTTPIGTRSVKPSLPSPLAVASSGTMSPGQRAGLGGGEAERLDGALGLDARRLQRLGRLGGDDPGELVAPLGEQAGGGVEDLGALPARQRSGGQRGLRRSPPRGRRRPPCRPAPGRSPTRRTAT